MTMMLPYVRCLRRGGWLLLALWVASFAPAGAEPAASPVTPELVAAAEREGTLSFYTAMEITVAEKLARAFEAKYPRIAVKVERSGAERIYQRVAQENASGIHVADVLDSSDVAHLLDWKREGLFAVWVPEDVLQWPAEDRDPDGYYAANRLVLSPIAYNTRLVKPEDAPKSYADLLDPKWKGKIVKAHPSYSGNILTSTFVLSRAIGWSYFEKLGQQRVMQVQSATEPPKKLALGERAIMADGTEYGIFMAQKSGAPVAVVYASEGTPLILCGSGVLKLAPHPNAARLFTSYLFSREGQQLLVDFGSLRSDHPAVKDPPGRVPLAEIKLLRSDAAAQEKAAEEIKRRYADYFGT